MGNTLCSVPDCDIFRYYKCTKDQLTYVNQNRNAGSLIYELP